MQSSRRNAAVAAWMLKATCWAAVATATAIQGAATARAQSWSAYGGNAQHTALGSGATQLPQRVAWSTPVDTDPQYSGSDLYAHYGSPLATRLNTILVPVKTNAAGNNVMGGNFTVKAFRGLDGSSVWSLASDYVLPHYNWVPPFSPSLKPKDAALVIPAAGGTVLVRTAPDSASGTTTRLAFFGTALYTGANVGTFNANLFISTPITIDAAGNMYFGFVSTGAALPGYPNGIPSGVARISAAGVGTFTSAAALTGGASVNNQPITKVNYNCAPAISKDGSTLYVGVNNVPMSSAGSFGQGYLCSASASTLAMKSSILLVDPHTGGPAAMSDDSTGTPTIGPDGDVYYGVLEANFPSNHARGWMLHFDSGLSTIKTPGAFGWDDSAAIVPANLVNSYQGTSSYLILTKYNNYADPGIGGNGMNMVAILDPNSATAEPITGTKTMTPVITVLGVTFDTELNTGVREWCINTAAIDPVNKCAIINSEDGHVYRWDFSTNSLSPGLSLTSGTGEAYTPTIAGPDGAVYAINNATLFRCIANP